MLKILLKKQLFEIFSPYFYDAKKNKARSRISTAMYFALFVLLIVGLLGGIFTFLSIKLCAPLVSVRLGWLYYALMGLIAVMLGTFGSVFHTYAGLYLPRDNDLLLSMPIPLSSLVAARLFSVYLMGMMYSCVVILPSVIVYWITAGISVFSFSGGLVLAFLISLFVLILSCFLGWAVAKISQKLRHKSVIAVLVSLAFIALYYFVYFKAQMIIQDLLANATLYGAQIRSSAYPLYLFGNVGLGNGKAILTVAGIVAIMSGLMWKLLSGSFLNLATSTGEKEHRKYRETASRKRSVDAALLSRELSHFLGNPNYMLNCGLGTFLMPVCAVAVLWNGGSFFATLEAMFADTSGSVPLMICVMLCGLASMNFMVAPSISLEGKSLWLMQSLPVDPWKLFQAKIRMQLILTVLPLLLCIVSIEIAYPLRPLCILIIVLFALSYTMLAALSGMVLGVKMPVLSWTNELMPVKQGASVMITLFGGMGYTVLLFAGFLLLPGWTLGFDCYMIICIAVNVILSICEYLWLTGSGKARFADL